MHVDHGIGGLGVGIKLVELLGDIGFDVIAIVGLVFAGMIVEEIGCGLVAVLKDAQVGDAREIPLADLLHLLVEGGVIGCDVDLEGAAVVEDARTCHLATLHIIKHTDSSTYCKYYAHYLFM